MSTSPTDIAEPAALTVKVSEDLLTVELSDGRILSVPVVWYPRLAHGSQKERANWQILGSGIGVHWPELDEDISVAGLLAGRRSGETQASLARWLKTRGPAPT